MTPTPMRPRDVFELVTLSVLWGAAYLFTRAAVPDFGAAPLACLRLGLAALMLLPLLLWRGGLPALFRQPTHMAMQGLPFTAMPFFLLAYASLHITAGLVAVLCATAPMFTALISHFMLKERMSAWRAVGLVVGFAGVAVLMWGGVDFKSVHGPLAVLAVGVVAINWGLAATYTKRYMAGIDPVVITVGSLGLASLFLAPFALAAWPATPPSTRAWAEVAFLGFASSGLGFLMYFRLLRRIGPVRAMSVTFLNPVVAMISGSFYLGESITAQMLMGGAVVLLGTALSLGLIQPRLWVKQVGQTG